MWVDPIDEAIGGGRAAGEEREHGEERRPPVPDWIVEWVSSQAPDPLRSMRAERGRRAIGREQALGALADGIRVRIHCRPDIELGVLGQRSGGGPAGRSI